MLNRLKKNNNNNILISVSINFLSWNVYNNSICLRKSSLRIFQTKAVHSMHLQIIDRDFIIYIFIMITYSACITVLIFDQVFKNVKYKYRENLDKIIYLLQLPCRVKI